MKHALLEMSDINMRNLMASWYDRMTQMTHHTHNRLDGFSAHEFSSFHHHLFWVHCETIIINLIKWMGVHSQHAQCSIRRLTMLVHTDPYSPGASLYKETPLSPRASAYARQEMKPDHYSSTVIVTTCVYMREWCMMGMNMHCLFHVPLAPVHE